MDIIIIIILLNTTLLSFIAFYTALSYSLKIGKNKVRLYVARDKDEELWLYIKKPIRGEKYFEANKHGYAIASFSFNNLGLNTDDYKDLKWEDEPVEVFLNLED